MQLAYQLKNENGEGDENEQSLFWTGAASFAFSETAIQKLKTRCNKPGIPGASK